MLNFLAIGTMILKTLSWGAFIRRSQGGKHSALTFYLNDLPFTSKLTRYELALFFGGPLKSK